MGYPVQQSTTAQPLVFLMVLASDHLTGATGLSPTVTISKNGGSFASPSGAVSEIGNGWYKVAGNATDNATLGPLLLHATAATADAADDRFDVVAYNPQDAVRLGLSGLPNFAAGSTSGGVLIVGTGAGAINPSGGNVPIIDNLNILAAINASYAGQLSALGSTSTGLLAALGSTNTGLLAAINASSAAQLTALAATAGGATIASRAPSSTALLNNTWADSKAAFLDASISKCAPTTSLTSGVITLSSTYDAAKTAAQASVLGTPTGASIAADIEALAATTGTGARTVTITVNDGSSPLQSARVRLTRNVTETYVGDTDVNGQVVFNVDDSTWSVAIELSGYTFAGDSLVVSADTSHTYSMTAKPGNNGWAWS